MATGEIQTPEVRSFLIATTFNELFEYGNGIFSLNTSASDPNRPTNASYWNVYAYGGAYGDWVIGQIFFLVE